MHYTKLCLLKLFSRVFEYYNHTCTSSVVCWQPLYKILLKNIFSPNTWSGYTTLFIHFCMTPESTIWLFSLIFAWYPKWLCSSFHLFSPNAWSGYMAHVCWSRLTPEAAILLNSPIFWPDARSGYMAQLIYFCLTPVVVIRRVSSLEAAWF